MGDEIPDYVVDWRGERVYPGDTIVYATVNGSSAMMTEAYVLDFRMGGGQRPEMKMRVQPLRTNGWHRGRVSSLSLNRSGSFTKIPHAFKNWETV